MKFITEDDLRDLYKKEPFTTYEIESGTRLTPGARQFLADRGINMFDDGPFIKKFAVTSGEDTVKQQDAAKADNSKPEKDWRKKKLYCKMKSAEALFLLTGEEILSRDVFLAQSVITLGKQFAGIRNFAEGKGVAETPCCRECSGINNGNFCKDIADCFEITEFHMQLEKGKEILNLNRLRSVLREIEPAVMECYEGNLSETVIADEIIEKVNSIINTLSQMICAAVGGKECQRKN